MAISEVLAALADDTRRKILLKLQEGKISSGDLAIALDMTPQALSYHLSKLKKADLIYETRYKNFIYYELNLSILDENNLIACQTAKKLFHVKKTIAKANNPKNVENIRVLGVDIVISATDSIISLLEREVDHSAIKELIPLNDGKAADKRALDYLQTVGISYSKAVIKAINAYLDLKTEEERKDAFP